MGVLEHFSTFSFLKISWYGQMYLSDWAIEFIFLSLLWSPLLGCHFTSLEFPWTGFKIIPWPNCLCMGHTYIEDTQTFFVMKDSGHEKTLQSINYQSSYLTKKHWTSQHKLDSSLLGPSLKGYIPSSLSSLAEA